MMKLKSIIVNHNTKRQTLILISKWFERTRTKGGFFDSPTFE